MGKARNLSKLSGSIDSTGIVPASKGGTGSVTGTSVPTVSGIVYPTGTAALPAGGQTITINGTNFNVGVKVLINTTQVGVVSRISSTQLTFVSPAFAVGTYIVYIVNTNGTTAILAPGIQYAAS
jgi:hypothetical protein